MTVGVNSSIRLHVDGGDGDDAQPATTALPAGRICRCVRTGQVAVVNTGQRDLRRRGASG